MNGKAEMLTHEIGTRLRVASARQDWMVAATHNYNDTTPFPAAKTIWSYKAIYHAGEALIGNWSATVSIAVGG